MRVIKTARHDKRRLIRVGIQVPYNDLPSILVHKKVLYDIYRHALSELHHEIGGYLLGFPAQDVETGAKITYIEKAIKGIYNSSPTHVTLHPTSFNEVERIREEDGTILVGWYHSHPKMGIFFSGTDIENHKAYHPEEYQIGIVVDPSKTPEGDIESNFEWIGFYGWNKDGNIVRLPIENVIYIENRPEIVLDEEKWRVHSLLPDQALKLEIGKKVEELSRLLRLGSHRFRSRLPIIIVSKSILSLLLQSKPTLPEEGLLLGEVNYVAGYTLVHIASFHPLDLTAMEDYQRYIRMLTKRFSNKLEKHALPPVLQPYFEGFRWIGFYCPESKLSRFSRGAVWEFRVRRPVLNLRLFARYLGKEYLIASIQRDRGQLIFYTWSDSEKKIQQIPDTQVIVK